MKETATFKWTREDGKYVIIENNVMKAFDADGNELSNDSDEANDLFVEMYIMTDETMILSKPEGIDLGDFHYQMHCAYRHIGHQCCIGGLVIMGWFSNPMFRPGFMHRRNHSKEELSEEEIAYQRRKHMIKRMQEDREEERERVARRKQEIIDTSIPYEIESEICPSNLITENNKSHIGSIIENRTVVDKVCKCYCDEICHKRLAGLCCHKHDETGHLKKDFKYNECRELKMIIDSTK